jgi:hypothetical protein
MRMRDDLDVFYSYETLTALFSAYGQPAESTWH